MLEALSDSFADEPEAKTDGTGAARQIDDQGLAANACGGAGENRGGHALVGVMAHDLAEAREFAIEHAERCLWRNVALGGARTAGRHNERTLFHVTKANQGGAEQVRLVGNENADELLLALEKSRERVFDFRAALVLVGTLRGAVAQSDSADLHAAICLN